jgi:flavin reductase (DIM6/NTAB) family NADH-FMN oxidoreductase RutF
MTTTPSDQPANPFADPLGARQPARRLRGRLTAPVTIVTAGEEDNRAGLTVSSVFVAEGEPPLLYFLVGATTDVFYAIEATGKVIVHVCEGRHRELADVFAGLRPSPGGVFAGTTVTQTEYGPALDGIQTKAFCTVRSTDEDSYSVIVSATIDAVEVGDVDDPLAYFRGRYRALNVPASPSPADRP